MKEYDKRKITEYCVNSMQIPCLIVSVISIVISVTIFGLFKDWFIAILIGSSIAIALIFYFGSYIKRNMWQLFSELEGLNKIYWENDKHV
ncbi:MAG: hypothetical protein KHY75_10390 [Enterococcus faecium]|nr:hypothetical protein [Enterococcus faecium]